MALNLSPERIAPRQLQDNQRAIEQHLNDSYYKRYLSAGMFTLIGGAVVGSSERFDFWSFADGVDTNRVAAHIEIPKLWMQAKLEFTIYYSGAAASTNPIRWRLLTTGVSENASIAVTDLDVSEDATGTTAADDLKRHTFTSYLSVVPSDLLLGVRVNRVGTHANDTYAATAYFLGLGLRAIPAFTEADTKGRTA